MKRDERIGRKREKYSFKMKEIRVTPYIYSPNRFGSPGPDPG